MSNQTKKDLEPQAEDVQKELAQALQEKTELHDRMMRIAAEYENYKKRVAREIEDAKFHSHDRLLREFLSTMDNIDRALQVAQTLGKTDPAVAALVEGVQLVQKQFSNALEKQGIQSFEAQGQPFDPQRHEAIQQVESDVLPVGSVASVLQRGYLLGNRVLRPALVAVVKAKSA